ncbi:MAG: YqhR family membrane protein [Bacillus sp. (in: firmicutes)]
MAADEQKNLDQNKQETQMPGKITVLQIGAVGGLFFSLVAFFASYFNFMEVDPRFLISWWPTDAWQKPLLGALIAILMYGLLSIIIAFIYYAILRKVYNLYVCILFGVSLWAIMHIVLGSFIPAVTGVGEMTFDTMVTSLCLYILYGVFVGYSISYDESERKRRKEVERQASEARQ